MILDGAAEPLPLPWLSLLRQECASQKFVGEFDRHSGQPRITVRGSATRNPGFSDYKISALADGTARS